MSAPGLVVRGTASQAPVRAHDRYPFLAVDGAPARSRGCPTARQAAAVAADRCARRPELTQFPQCDADAHPVRGGGGRRGVGRSRVPLPPRRG